MDIFDFLKDYSNGEVIGDSGLYRHHDEGSTESMDDFASRVQKAAQGNGEWGTEGRPVEALGGSGFANGLSPVTIDGQQYNRTGLDSSIGLDKVLPGVDPSTVSRYDPKYGFLLRSDKYSDIMKEQQKKNDGGWFGYNTPFEAFSKTIGPAMGIGNALSLGSQFGFPGAASALEGSGYQSLFSSLAQNAASQGGSFSDLLGNFGFGGNSPPLTGSFEDSPWGVNSREFSDAAAEGTGAQDMAGSKGVFDSYGNPLYEGPSGFQRLTGALQGQMDGVNSILGNSKNPITLGGLGMAGANYLIQSSLADKYTKAAKDASDRANALNDPRRQQYQAQLSQLLTNPQSFFATNPVVQGQLDLARQQFNANSAKMGTGGTQFNDYLKNVQNIASGSFNDQANLLGGLGGFNQGAGFSGNLFGSLSDKGLQQQAEAFRGLGQQLFGKLGQSNQQQPQSPSGTNIVSLS